ncbi:Proton-dependent oligopeptide transporter [Parasponia andersonii]|uniref:Proton-dependent oligopeptide transporter n=1 Tax=Parasponia andersonii TaxID=3476 RepID=A0A2P5BNZ3_PARAD|nr:Proton-dependent oligopeptide transporter [Parasponia andersonii]
MEISLEQMKNTQKTEIKKGGLRTMPFIISNEAFEKLASIGLHANMINYLRKEYHLDVATGLTILFLWGAISNFTPIIGAFLSDSHLGRFRVIALGTTTTLLGMFVLWLTAIIPQARPPQCDIEKAGQNRVPANLGQLVLLLFSFSLMSVGAGGVRPCSMAFGADQLDRPENPKNGRVLQSFFNWYYASVGVSMMISVTVIVYLQEKRGWIVGFGVPAGLMLLSTVLFFSGSSLYVRVNANKNLFAGFAYVVAASWKNRHLALPPENFDAWYYLKGSKLVRPTDKLRFLNKACIIKNPEKDLTPEGLALDPWSLSTVKQVEELKAILKVIPIWSTGIFIAAIVSQQSVYLTLAKTTDRNLTPHFKIPPGSFVIFSILTMLLWVALYDRAVVHLVSSLTNRRRRGLSFKQRMGIGLAIACVAMAVAAAVESKRRRLAVVYGETMSWVWLVPQYCLIGLAEAFNAIGQIEFYYSQFPKTMTSIAIALFALGMGFGNLIAALIVRIVNEWSGNEKSGKVEWVSNDPNKGHYDYYCWVLTALGLVNLVYYLVCSWAYGPCQERKVWDFEEGQVEGLEVDLGKSKGENGKEEECLTKSEESSSIVFNAA